MTDKRHLTGNVSTGDTIEIWADDEEIVIFWRDAQPGDWLLYTDEDPRLRKTLSYTHVIKVPKPLVPK